MKKILFALITVLALSGTAEARNQYSNQEAGEFNLLDSILGTTNSNWSVSPRIHGRARLASRHHYTHTAGRGRNKGASASIVAYGRMLQHSGFRVSEHPAFGGVHPVHHGWAHYAGRAIDINIGRGVREASNSGARHRFDNLAARARAAGYTVLWKVAGHFDHMHIQR